MPRPGVEPGLEVPETSVMSFSLPGQTVRQPTELYQQSAPDKRTSRTEFIPSAFQFEFES